MKAEKDENGKLPPDEQRLTKVGKMLRSTSLDELPELVNIFSFLPGLFCLNIAGLPKNIKTKIPVSKNIGNVITIAIIAKIISKNLFTYFRYITIPLYK